MRIGYISVCTIGDKNAVLHRICRYFGSEDGKHLIPSRAEGLRSETDRLKWYEIAVPMETITRKIKSALCRIEPLVVMFDVWVELPLAQFWSTLTLYYSHINHKPKSWLKYLFWMDINVQKEFFNLISVIAIITLIIKFKLNNVMITIACEIC